MQIVSKAKNWLTRQVASNKEDFSTSSNANKPQSNGMVKAGGIGAGVGAAAGGGLAYHSLSKDFTYFDYVTEEMPLGESGPTAASVFGADFEQLQKMVAENSNGAKSGEQSLQYLSYLKHQSPKASTADIQGIYNSLEGQLGNDTEVRESLNMISAHVAKHGTTPNEAHAELASHFHMESDFGKGTSTFLEGNKIEGTDLKETSIYMKQRHSSRIGHLGMTKGLALGAAAGAGIGLFTGLAVNLLSRVMRAGE